MIQQLRRVVVSGLGVVTPAGCGVQTTWNALFGSKGYLRNSTEEDNLDFSTLGQITMGMLPRDLSTEFWSQKLEEKNDCMAPLLCSATEALDDAGWTPTKVKDRERSGISFSTTEMRSRHILDELRSLDKPNLTSMSRNAFLQSHKGFVCGQIAKKYNFQGPVRIFASACASGQITIGNAFRMIQEGEADVILATAATGSPETLSLAGLVKMGVFAHSAEDPESACRPFDESHLGTVISLGGGAMVLEELSHALKRKAKIYCEVRGFGAFSEGEHPVRPQNEGAGFIVSMQKAVEDAGLTPEDIAHVRTHSTGTVAGDLSEAISIDRYFRNHKPVISSSKGHIGHFAESAGIVESVIAILCVKNDTVPPIRNLKQPITIPGGNTLNFARGVVKKPINAALVNGEGFGGVCASVIYSKYST